MRSLPQSINDRRIRRFERPWVGQIERHAIQFKICTNTTILQVSHGEKGWLITTVACRLISISAVLASSVLLIWIPNPAGSRAATIVRKDSGNDTSEDCTSAAVPVGFNIVWLCDGRDMLTVASKGFARLRIEYSLGITGTLVAERLMHLLEVISVLTTFKYAPSSLADIKIEHSVRHSAAGPIHCPSLWRILRPRPISRGTADLPLDEIRMLPIEMGPPEMGRGSFTRRLSRTFDLK